MLTVRRWCKELLDAGVGAASVSKAYRLLQIEAFRDAGIEGDDEAGAAR